MSEVDDLLAKKPQGFRVAFEKRERGMLGSDYFPERDEPLIQIEAEAWEWAGRFAAKAPPEYVNIYVVDHQYRPVDGYRCRLMRRYPS